MRFGLIHRIMTDALAALGLLALLTSGELSRTAAVILAAGMAFAIAVPESEIEPAAARIRRDEGIDAGPETGAALVALERLVASRLVRPDETVVVFNTGANKYHQHR